MQSSKYFLVGKRAPDWIKVIDVPLFYLLRPSLLIVLSIMLAWKPQSIINARFTPYPVEWVFFPTVFFFILICWLLAHFLINVFKNMNERRNQRKYWKHSTGIHRAILRSPSAQVLKNFDKNLRALWTEELEDFFDEVNEDSQGRINNASEKITKTLTFILEITSKFAQRSQEKYSANIMISDPNLNENERLRFTHGDSSNLFTVLNYRSDLAVHEIGQLGDPLVPAEDVLLPVYKSAENKVLPGAPLTFHKGRLVCYESTNELTDWMRDRGWEQEIVSEVENFFGPEDTMDQEGMDGQLASFLSARIGGQDNPKGVLNVNCTQEGILNCDREYWITYRALLEPLLIILDRLVHQYSLSDEYQNSRIS